MKIRRWLPLATVVAILASLLCIDLASAVWPHLDVEKLVSVDDQGSWDDADLPPGPQVSADSPVWFKFIVTNMGNTTLTDVTLSDSVFTDALKGCAVPYSLGLGESFECVIGPFPAEAGQHTNTATVTGTYGKETYTDTDDANYTGVSINLEKYVTVDAGNTWYDADETTGPEVQAGSETVWFKFVVTNLRGVTLSDVTLADSDFDAQIDSQCTVPAELDPGESFECTIGPFAAQEGQHTNTATATGTYVKETYTDTDDANYLGVAPSIDIEKSTNGDDADTPSGPEIVVGETVVWNYRVENTGDLDLNDVTVVDDNGTPDSPADDYTCTIGFLASGAVDDTTCSQSGTAEAGQYANTAKVTGDYDGITVEDADPSHYFGVELEPTTLTLDPDDATNQLPTDTSHDFTATVRDQYGDPLEGVLVSFSTTFGAFESNDNQYVEVETDASGQATVTIVSTTPGSAQIRAWIDGGDEVYTEGELTDEPSTKTWTGEGPTSLDVEKTVEVLWARSYDWSITKSVEPDALELAEGESSDVTYTIDVVRSAAGDSYTVKGTISAQNDVENAAHILLVEDVIEYKLPGSGDWIELTRETVAGESWIPAGGLGEWEYEFPFSPVEDATYNNVAYVTLANHPDGEHIFHYRISFDLPDAPTSEEDACATVTDVQTIPDGLSVTDDYPEGGWNPCDSATYTIDKTVTNDSAEPGTYDLDNTATVTEEDTSEEDTADATVTITVPETTPRPDCIELVKTIDGPYRTSDDLPLEDKIIPVAVMRDIDPPGTANTENLFYFLVEITVENCGDTELTGVEVEDTFSNQAQPFWTDDEANVTVTAKKGNNPATPNDPNNGMVQETLTWSVGTLQASESRTLQIKVGTEFNPSGRLEPTSTGGAGSIYYNGRDNQTRSASVTTNEGPSASVDAMFIEVGSDEISCQDTDGEWYQLDFQTGNPPNHRIRQHDKCVAVTTALPITLSDDTLTASDLEAATWHRWFLPIVIAISQR